MYESHYGLNKKPFQITTDPNFLWMGTKHREALATLKYGVMDNKGFLLLTGDVGTGKTTLINRLTEDVKDKVYTAKIPDPRLTKYDFYRMVSRYFKLPIEVRTKSDFIEPFSRFLNDAQQEKKSVLLMIDEAQRLKHDLMEEIRLLSNLESQDVKMLNIFFIGQNEFNGILLQPENRALMRRITITYNIDPLTQAETAEYIRHRLNVAGAAYEIFSAGAVEEVYDFSNGFPRQINIISDLAMFFASQMDQRTIGRKVVRQCRERISFSLTEEPVTAGKRVVTPSPGSLEPATADHAPRGRSPVWRLYAAIGVVLLLVCGTGIYFTAPDWKAGVHQWILQIGRSEGERSGPPAAALRQDQDVDTGQPPDASEDGVPPAVAATQDLGSPPPPYIPLRMPSRPPDFEIGATAKPAIPVPSPLAVPPSTATATDEPPQPDPADAVEWVLKKRQQGNPP
jgi:type II secretory pathway predicted ATPase ExeA